MKRVFFPIIVLMFLALVSAYAIEEVQVDNIEDNKGGPYAVAQLTEDGQFFNDREQFPMTNIPEEFLGLTLIQTSANCPAGQDWRLTFEIDRDAYIYTAWDSRFPRPEERGQEPKDWFTDNYKDTEKVLCLDAPHPKTDYWIYKSNKPYPKGEVEFFGIDVMDPGDPVNMWTIFLEAGKLAVSSPQEKLAARWGEIKSLK